MKGATLAHQNSTLTSPVSILAHIYDNFIRSSWLQNGTTPLTRNILISVFGRNVIILSTFLLISLCVGVGVLVCAVLSLKRHQSEGGRVSALVVSLLLTDVLEFLLIPFGVTTLLNVLVCIRGINCYAVGIAFSFARQCGFCFHQLVALEAILSLNHPHGSTLLSNPLCSIPVCVTVWIWALVPIFCSSLLLLYIVVSLIMGGVQGVTTIVIAITSSIIMCLRSCPSDQSSRVLAVALCTLAFLYGPLILWGFIITTGLPVLDLGFISLSVMSFRLVTDPLLCVLVYRKTQSSAVVDVSTNSHLMMEYESA